MRVFIWSAHRRRQWLAAAVCVAMAAVLLIFPQAASTGIKRGLAVCGQLLIPSLFPFLVLSGFTIRSGIVQSLGRLLEPLMRRLYGFSGSAAGALLISMLGGYPAGAGAVTQLLERGEITKEEAKRLLRCCVNAGPAFILGGVGVGMLGSAQAGLLLCAAHWLSSGIVTLLERRRSAPTASAPTPAMPLSLAVIDSVHHATTSLLSMCGFVLLSSAGLSLLDASGVASSFGDIGRCLLTCTAEVTTGCVEAAGMGQAAPFWLGAALGFGGLSVHGQVAAVTASHHLVNGGFFRARLLHALLGGCLSALFFYCMPPSDLAVSVGAVFSAYHPDNSAIGISGLLALLLLCIIFLYTLPRVRSHFD